MMRRFSFSALGLILSLLFGSNLIAQPDTVIRLDLGYFEAGLSPVHALVREEFERQLRALAPDNIEVRFIPQGYGSADWKRDSCRTLAQVLSSTPGIDLMIAIGPWVIEDLLAAGYSEPILGLRQFDPLTSELIDATGRPVANNLTLHFQPNKIEDDIIMLTRLVPVKKLGLLFFASDSSEQVSLVERVGLLGRQAGFEVVTSDGYDNYGTYAFFNALNKLPKDVDAVYLGPLWSMDITKISSFFERLTRAGIPTFTWEGRSLVDHGAMASNSAFGLVSEARFNALKAIRIARGETPADLPVAFRSGTSLAINEETAKRCRVTLPAGVREEAYLVPEPAPENAEYYDLMTAISRTLSGNPASIAGMDALEQADYARSEAVAAYLPQINLEAFTGRVDRNTVANTVEHLSRAQYGADLNLSQTLFSLERIKAIKLASRIEDLSEVEVRRGHLELEQAVVKAYIACLQADEEYLVQLRYRQVVERNLEIAAVRMHLEDESQLSDFIRWQDERQGMISRTLAAETRKKIARLKMNALFNLPLDLPLQLDSTVVDDERIFRIRDLLEQLLATSGKLEEFQRALVRAARANHPDLQTLKAQTFVQESRLALNRSRFFPDLNLKATMSLVDRQEDIAGSFEERHGTWSVSGRLSLPLFEGGGRYHERSRLKAAISETEYRSDAAVLELTGEIHSLVEQLISMARVVPRLLRSSELAMQNLGLVSEDYESGRVGISGLLEAYYHALETELLAIDTNSSFHRTMADLIYSVGWSSQEEGRPFYDLFRTQLVRILEH